jgi:arsenate reductase
MESIVIKQLSALSHPQRLAIFRLLMRRYPGEVPAGEIARILDLKPNTASVYLSALRDGGLILQQRRGTSLLYRVDLHNAETLIQYLFNDCCKGRPALCIDAAKAGSLKGTKMSDRKYNVLFICTGNSARSIFAEAIMRAEAGDRFNAYSAGSAPRSTLNPIAIEMIENRGMDISQLRAKNLSEFQQDGAPVFDFVFTVCDLAANEECPAWTGQPISAHWGLPDPVKATGTDAEKRLAFQQTFGALSNRIKAFAALPFASLDRASLQKHVDQIGQTSETV